MIIILKEYEKYVTRKYLDSYVKLKVGARNNRYYREKGYNFQKLGEEIEVKIEDVYPYAHTKVLCECPMCHTEHYSEYRDTYNRNHTLCPKCAAKVFLSKNTVCAVCGEKAHKTIDGTPYCYKHQIQIEKYGKILDFTRQESNFYTETDECTLLHIRDVGKQTERCVIKIDKNDAEAIAKYNWTLSINDDFVINKNNEKLHRYIYKKHFGNISKKYILFVNGDKFDMRKENLIESNEKIIKKYKDPNTDVKYIFTKDNLQVGVIDDTHYKLLNIRELKDFESNKKPIIVEVDKNGCWNCISHSQHPDGYVYVFSKTKKIKLHKRVLELKIGRKLDTVHDELTRHKCDNPQCCNPDHLEIGNSQQNHDDMVSRGRGYWQNHTGYFKWNKRKSKDNKILDEKTVVGIYTKAMSGEYTYSEIDRMYKLCRGATANIVNKKTYLRYTDGLMCEDKRNQKAIANYLLVRNLQDGNIYTNRELSNITGINRETIRNIVNKTYYITDDDLKKNNLVISGDGSGVLYYMDILYETVVDGTGLRNTIYCAKCNLQCDGCHNKESWDINNGKPVTVNKAADMLLKNGLNITFSGGECTIQNKAFIRLAKKLKENGRNIWLYSGNTYEDLIENKENLSLLKYIDVLVDGPYIKEQRDITLKWRGSSNQRVIDVQETLKQGRIVLYCD